MMKENDRKTQAVLSLWKQFGLWLSSTFYNSTNTYLIKKNYP